MSIVRGLAEAVLRMGRIDIRQARYEMMEKAAARIEAAVKLSLALQPGEDHTAPWLRTGQLYASVSRQMTQNAAIIGSTDPVAVYQELGTQAIPPRPFLAAAAAAEAEGVTQDIAGSIRTAIEG